MIGAVTVFAMLVMLVGSALLSIKYDWDPFVPLFVALGLSALLLWVVTSAVAV